MKFFNSLGIKNFKVVESYEVIAYIPAIILSLLLILFGFVPSSWSYEDCRTVFYFEHSYYGCEGSTSWLDICSPSLITYPKDEHYNQCRVTCSKAVYSPVAVRDHQSEVVPKARLVGPMGGNESTTAYCQDSCSDYQYVKTFGCYIAWNCSYDGHCGLVPTMFCCTQGSPPEAAPCAGVQCPEGQSIINLETCTCGCYQDYRDACLAASGAVFDDNACQCNCTLPRIYDLWVDLDCGNRVASVYAWNGGENNSLYYPSGRLYRWVNNQELFISDVSGSFSTANLAPGSYYIVYDEVNVYCSEYSYDWYINIEIDAECSGGCILTAPSEEGGPPVE